MTQTFADRASESLADAQLRRNLRKATTHIRAKRASGVAERDDWEQLREAGRRIKAQTVRHLDQLLHDLPPHILFPANQLKRDEIRAVFMQA
jgi:L-lactate dehydrogenase complex protein LldF